VSIVASTVVDAALADVFGWHERPGAVKRLLPPWQPIRVRSEAANLRDGRAELVLAGGIPWVAQHSGYRPPHEFTDELVSLPFTWRHHHEFGAEPDGRTRVTDRVDTPVPEALLRATFRYRHAQLADDLAVNRAMAALRPAPQTVAVTGASGLIGTALTAQLTTGGHRVIRLVRRDARDETERRWDTDNPAPDLLDGVDALVHLAGASIAGRFTEAHRRAVRDSRIEPTRRLAELAAAAPDGPRAFVCASAVGYYGPDPGDELLDENSGPGRGFLADLVTDWEAAAAPAARGGVRVVNVRTGIVQTPRGGVLQIMRPLFSAGLGGRLGSGRQWTSWIDLDDLTDVYLRALVDETMSGPVNAVAPEPVRNSDYARVLAHVLRRPAVLPVPALGPRLVLGAQGADEFALAGQRVLPQKLLAVGHRFRRPQLEACLRHQLGRLPPGRG
jgi:uncharacterized protein (TIGR01777 family)